MAQVLNIYVECLDETSVPSFSHSPVPVVTDIWGMNQQLEMLFFLVVRALCSGLGMYLDEGTPN